MSNLLLPVEKAQAILDYLAAQPYREVAPLIADLMNLDEAPESEPAE